MAVEIEYTDDDVEFRSCEYFRDGRSGKDRWGTPYQNKIACGTGWGDEEYVCPLYVEESCPGALNDGNRIRPSMLETCDVDCEACGGGDRAVTDAFCGQEYSTTREDYVGEDGEFPSLRLDSWASSDDPKADAHAARYDCSAEAKLEFPVSWFPVVRHNLDDKLTGTWMDALDPAPAIVATGGDFVWGVMRGRKKDGVKRSLRERLGVPEETKILVHGQILDDKLDQIWDNRSEFMDYCLEEGVAGMVVPQFSCYPDAQNAMAVYNLARSFEWHLDCVDKGFEHVVFQHPGIQADWLHQECYDFVNRIKAKLVAFSIQTHGAQGGLIPESMKDHQDAGEGYHEGVDFIHFGATTHLRMKMAAVLVGALDPPKGKRQRRMIYSNVVAAAGASFYNLLPMKVSAPPGMTKGQVFAHNVEQFVKMGDMVLER